MKNGNDESVSKLKVTFSPGKNKTELTPEVTLHRRMTKYPFFSVIKQKVILQ